MPSFGYSAPASGALRWGGWERLKKGIHRSVSDQNDEKGEINKSGLHSSTSFCMAMTATRTTGGAWGLRQPDERRTSTDPGPSAGRIDQREIARPKGGAKRQSRGDFLAAGRRRA